MARHPVYLSVDVEAWGSATILQETGRVVEPEAAVVDQVETLLEMMQDEGAKATWFFLGEVAYRFPALARRVAAEGHELGVHGLRHHQVGALGPGRFGESVHRAKGQVEEASGAAAPGFRAVDFSIGPGTEWALDELVDAGFEWDASLFPMRRPRYGVAGAPLTPHWASTPLGRRIPRVPVTVASLAGVRVPFAGGGYLRVMPFAMVSLLASISRRQGPVVFYLHPVEISRDRSVPVDLSGLTPGDQARVLNRHRSESRGRGPGKVRRLLSRFGGRPIGELVAAELSGGER